MTFLEKLEKKWKDGKYVCVGLDPVIEKIPKSIKGKNVIFEFNKAIIDSTHDLVASYKPNSAFYEAEGENGIKQLEMTTSYIRENYPDIFLILDAKRADIGNTNEGYVKFAFDYLGMDAITVHPYLGREAIEPFLSRKDKGVFVLCRTSNSGAGEFQDLDVGGIRLYEKVAFQVSNLWNFKNNVALVVGSTYPVELKKVRNIARDIPLLIPGVGAQGGDIVETVKAANKNFIINSSRGVIYASSDTDFAQKAREEVEALHKQITDTLAS